MSKIETEQINTVKRLDLPLDNTLTRGLDIAASALGLLVLSPVFAGISLAIKLHDGGPVFYRGLRVGKDGQEFRLYKFRTMVMNADRMGSGITTNGDSRITPIGRFLRKTKLDELPQLINVLASDMSLVGPRPEDPRYVALYTPEQRRILDMRPGITSAASLTYRNEEQMLSGPDWETVYIDEVMPSKLTIDLSYMAQRSLFSDVKLILRTVAAMIK